MQTTIGIINIIFILLIITSPFFVSKYINKKKINAKIIISIFLSVILIITLSFVFGWWTHYSDKILLQWYGYNLELMPDTPDRYINVAPQDKERVETLRMGYMGIGWPLQIIYSLVFVVPFAVIIPIFFYVFKKNKQ